MIFSLSDVILIGGFALNTGIVLQRLQVLEKKQDEHNNGMKKLAIVQQDLEILKERQKTANHRIEDLEKNHG